MIFTKIALTNLFSYYGKCSLEIEPKNSEKNIVLIYGRNNFGKTNLLNSIKLLFVGTANDELRIVGEGGEKKLTQKQYIMGKEGLWDGLLNKTAHRRGEDTCSIEIEWLDDESNLVRAERRWTIYRDSADEEVKIYFPNYELVRSEAEDYLQSQLPKDFVPFFFFDGEKIQELAVGTEAARASQIERLLNISPLIAVCKQLSELQKAYKKELLSPTAKAEVKKAEAELAKYESEIAIKQLHLSELSDEIQDIENDLSRIRKHKDSFTVHSAWSSEAAIKKEIFQLEEQYTTQKESLEQELPRIILFLANPSLVDNVYSMLNAEQAQIANNDVALLRVLRSTFASQLLDAPPYSTPRLTDPQLEFYKSRITKILDSYIDIQPDKARKLKLSLEECSALKEFLSQFKSDNSHIRQRASEELVQLAAIKRELENKHDQVLGLASLSANEQEKFRELERQENDSNSKLLDKYSEKRSIEADIDVLHRSSIQARSAIEEALKREEEASKNDARLELSQTLNHFFGEFRDRLRRGKKDKIQQSLNEKFITLMGSNDRIKHIHVDENFTLEYFDEHGERVGRASISAGTKQLVATSLLWALNAASDKAIPVVIDTPLARIDKEHQNSLLENYYPNVARQVIILPTNSEIDTNKLKLISPYVYKQYSLDNPDGKTTKISLSK